MTHKHLARQITEAMIEAFSSQDRFIPLHEPCFKGNEWTYIKACLDTGWVSSAGQYVNQFEQDIAKWTGSPYAVAVMNGTAALHIALMLAGVEPGDEVLLPSLTFVATANAVRYCGATPHFIEVSMDTMGADPYALQQYLESISTRNREGKLINKETQQTIAAVLPMHTFGHPADIEHLLEVCNQFQLPLIEDAAESLGSYYKNKHTGTFGLMSAISFNGNKIITTGGGGAILTADQELARRAKHLTTTAKAPHAWEFQHDEVGYNYRMPNLNAALGCAQLEQLPGLLQSKRELAHWYAELWSSLPGISFFTEPDNCSSNYWLNAILLEEPDKSLRDQILSQLNEANLMSRPIWTPMHKLPMFNHCPRMELTITEQLESRVINIPSSPSLLDATK